MEYLPLMLMKAILIDEHGEGKRKATEFTFVLNLPTPKTALQLMNALDKICMPA
jgi:hypothetical protein